MLSLAGIWHWHGRPGSGYLTLALFGSVVCLALHSWRIKSNGRVEKLFRKSVGPSSPLE
jgi:hypothetical protein